MFLDGSSTGFERTMQQMAALQVAPQLTKTQ
jgi:hypothetical protein